jgi:MerR family transcriptional regulator/heat shock protein HspR
VELFEVDEEFIADLEEEEVVRPIFREKPPAKLFSSRDLERLRVAKTLMAEMGVNLAGVEVVLRMRQNLIEMRKQFDAILEDVAQHLKETFKENQE